MSSEELKALKTTIEQAGHSEDVWRIALYIATFVVVIGLIKEYKEPIAELVRLAMSPLRDRFPFDGARFKMLFGKTIGGVLVTVGVAAELLSERGASHADSLARTANAKLVAEMNAESARLRAAIAGRELTADQQHKIAVALAKYSGKTVWVSSYAGDPEGKRLAIEIMSALRLAHIDTEDRSEQLFSSPMKFGIEIQCMEDAQKGQRDFAKVLISILADQETGNLKVAPLSQFGCQVEGLDGGIEVGIKPPTLE
jgi:hypothetical protein